MIGKKLIAWYEANKRNLPWRDTSNPYLIWVSEIILQQTRVNQGLDYYYRFIEQFPDIFSLANANIDDVLKIWQGLGYYSRARNMHAAAQHILTMHQGQFPETYDKLVTIRGIGDYTASAIASMAFGQAVPVVDGNVNRVIARLFCIQDPVDKPQGKKIVRRYAGELMVAESPGTYNQAIMEFGALYCSPHSPDCEHCILNDVCVAYAKDLVDMLPVKSKPPTIKMRYFHYLVVTYCDKTYIQRRPGGDIWTGLYEFPMIETGADASLEELSRSDMWQTLFKGQILHVRSISTELTHRLTHRVLKIRFYEILIDQPMSTQGQIEIFWKDIHHYAVHKVMDNYLEKRTLTI